MDRNVVAAIAREAMRPAAYAAVRTVPEGHLTRGGWGLVAAWGAWAESKMALEAHLIYGERLGPVTLTAARSAVDPELIILTWLAPRN